MKRREEANSPKKRRGENKINKEKDPMDLIKKKIERQMIENRMEKKIDSKVYYSQDRYLTKTTMDKKLLHKCNWMIL